MPSNKSDTSIISLPRYLMESIGKKLSTLTQKKHDFQTFSQSQAYQSIDLTQFNASLNQDFNTHKNAFHDQIPQLSKQLFGNTSFGEWGTLVDKIVPPETLKKISNKGFLQIGKLAQSWAEADLGRDKRFLGQLSLDINERHALAQAIAHQNRALVAVGSVSNLAGLVGILGDTVWLLILALRSIFQIASIYDKPLTGTAGIQIAYQILAKAELSKLQEKQTLLAGIGMVEAIVDKNSLEQNSNKLNPQPMPTKNSQSHEREVPLFRLSELTMDVKNGDYSHLTKFANKKTAEHSSLLTNVMDYLATADTFARRINLSLHAINFNKLNKILPIAAVGIGASYNNLIIDEVLNIAMATFAPPPKPAKVEKLEQDKNLKVTFESQ